MTRTLNKRVKVKYIKDIRNEFKGTIPLDVLYDARLTDVQKLLYCNIAYLTLNCDYCWAGNLYFEKLLGRKVDTISKAFSKLVELKYIRTEVNKFTNEQGQIKSQRMTWITNRNHLKVLRYKGGRILIPKDTILKQKINNEYIDIKLKNHIEDYTTNNNKIAKMITKQLYNLEKYGVKGEILEDKLKNKGKGIRPLFQIIDERVPDKIEPMVNLFLKAYMKRHLGVRKLPTPEKLNETITQLIKYATPINLNCQEYSIFSMNTEFALDILEKAIIGKNGAPFVVLDEIKREHEMLEWSKKPLNEEEVNEIKVHLNLYDASHCKIRKMLIM